MARPFLVRVCAIVSALAIGQAIGAAVATDAVPPVIELFTRPGCVHCARAKVWLEELAARRPEVRWVEHDVDRDVEARARLLARCAALGMVPAVPAFLIGGERLFVGFDGAGTTGARLEAALADLGAAPRATLRLPLVGEIAVDRPGLPLFTVAVGLVDGFNPCAMWVLLFLLSLLVNLRSRRRMALIGGTFVVVSGLVYLIFMGAWLGAFLLLGVARWLQAGLGLLAVLIGAVHLKDAWMPGRGPSLSIPESAKPGIYARMRRIVYAEDLGSTLVATIVLAVVVNFIELACTAGLPAIYTQVLARHELSPLAYQGYLLLYVVAYMLDDAAMLTLAVVTLTRRKVQERGGRVLQLVSGGVMVVLGLLLLLAPGWLTLDA